MKWAAESRQVTTCAPQYGAHDARDSDGRSKTALVAESKASKPRRLLLTEEGCRLLEELTAGKGPNDFALVKADGTGWQKSEQHRRIHEAETGSVSHSETPR